jgi:hypothetical protein
MDSAIAEIKPNINKAFLLNLLIVLAIVAGIIGLLVFLNMEVGLDLFVDTFQMVGIEINPQSLLWEAIGTILVVTSLLLIMNYVSLGKVTYTLYPDRIVYSKSFFIFQAGKKETPYGNVTKVYYHEKPFLNTAKIILELSGLRQSRMEMDFMDHPGEVAARLQELIREYRSKYYAQYSQQYRLDSIMDRIQ